MGSDLNHVRSSIDDSTISPIACPPINERLSPTSMVHPANRISSSFLGVTIATAVSYGLIYVKYQLIAFYFGAGAMSDVFLVSHIIPYTVVQLLTHTLGTVLVPVYTELRLRKGNSHARAYIANLCNITGAFTLLLTLLVLVAAPLLISMLAPGLESGERSTAILLTRIMIPSIVFNGIVTVLFGFLNAGKRFVIRQLIVVANGLAIVLLIIVLQNSMGIMAPAAAIVGASVLQLAVAVLTTHRAQFCFQRVFNLREAGFSRTLKLSSVVALGTLFGYLSPVVDRVIASHLPAGSLSCLEYGVMTSKAIAFVIVVPLSTILLTSFADLFQRGETGEMLQLMGRSMTCLSYIVYPVSAGLLFLSEPVVAILFERGAFDAQDTQRTVMTLRYYSVWLFFTGLDVVASRVFYAMQKVKVPIVVGMVGMGTKVIFSFILVRHLAHAGLALATALGSIVKPMIFLVLMSFLFSDFKLTPLVGRHLRIGANSLIAAFCATGVFFRVLPMLFEGSSTEAKAGMLMVSALVGSCVYFFMSWLTRTREQVFLWNTLRHLRSGTLQASPEGGTPC